MSRAQSNLGAANEMLVSADLLKQGYEVFRALSGHASCDLLAMRDSIVERVEVRTAFPSRTTKKDGTLYIPVTQSQLDKFDTLAIVHLDGSISYLRHEDVKSEVMRRSRTKPKYPP